LVTDLEQRYRGPSRASRLVALVLVVALAASGGGFLVWTLVDSSTPEVNSQMSAFEILDDHTAVATITVLRDSQFTEATCTLVAIAADHTVVGTVPVRVADGPEKQTMRVEIRTERRATSIDNTGCTTPNQPRPR
jgi:hypothetical protein